MEENMDDKTLTENLSLTFSTTKDARLDFFFHVIEGSSPERTTELLEKSWTKSPLDTMKMLLNLRDIRGGKGIRPQALICLQWLYRTQFNNLMLNLIHFDKFGCWKDYLNLLLIALFDILPYDVDTSERKSKNKNKYTYVSPFDSVILKSFPKEKRRALESTETICHQVELKYKLHDKWVREKIERKKLNVEKIEYKNKHKYFSRYQIPSTNATIYYKFKTNKAKLRLLNEYRLEYCKNAYENNDKFRQLYDKIVVLFAEQLFNDYVNYIKEKFDDITLASKWMPNLGRHYDKYLAIVLPVANKFFDMVQNSSYKMELDPEKLNEEKSKCILFSRTCTTLRKKIQVPEIFMSANEWYNLDYNRVPSNAVLRYKRAFIRNDKERFNEFISSKPLKAAALTPADFVKQIMDNFALYSINHSETPCILNEQQKMNLKVIDNQWKSLIENIKSNGSIIYKNTLAICDVSGSMMYSSQMIKPINASIGLTLFLLQLSDSKWYDSFISFSENPTFHKVNLNTSLLDQVRQCLTADAGFNTNLNKVFDTILERAKVHNLSEEEMPKVLFIFTDMEFDCAMKKKTNFEVCQSQYQEAGYKLPFIIFWNLKGEKTSRSTPVKFNQDGVILLSGFSAQTFKFLLSVKNLNELTPLAMLLRIINDPRYDCVQVLKSNESNENQNPEIQTKP